MKTQKVFSNLESNIDQLMRDERFIKIISSNINLILKVQDFTHRKLESVLKVVDVPTIKSMDNLFNTIKHLEETVHHQAEKIVHLENQLATLQNDSRSKGRSSKREILK